MQIKRVLFLILKLLCLVSSIEETSTTETCIAFESVVMVRKLELSFRITDPIGSVQIEGGRLKH